MMNKRIQELAIESAKYLDWDFPNDPTEYTFTSDSLSKFAELIVLECAEVAGETRWAVPPTQEQIARSIKQHFGVEE
jgi:hypothetical protein